MNKPAPFTCTRPRRVLRWLLCLCLLLVLSPVTAQAPLSWEVSAAQTGPGTYALTLEGTIAPGWHVYAVDDASLGLTGAALELADPSLRLLPPEPLLPLDSLSDPLFEGRPVQVYTHRLALRQILRLTGQVPATLPLTLTAYASNGETFVPLREERQVALPGGTPQHRVLAASLQLPSLDPGQAAACGEPGPHDGSMSTLFLLGFLGGLLALLTPCVFPMVPLTVTFFSSRSAGRRQALRHGLLFGLFILLIYLACSLPFHLLEGVEPGIFNSLSTNVWVNLFFFVVFVLFALSFFGLFELTLPGRFTTRVDSLGNLGSWGGIFFLALTLALVSFSCTGPILGTLLVGSLSSDSGAWQLTAGLGGFGLALALPFALFAVFPGWLQRMPRSGGWLGTVKRSLAFVELALAVKFLSNADLVAQWGLLPREVFLGSWLLLALALALYLFGLLRFRDEPPPRSLGWKRKLAGTLVLLFAGYLAPGLGKAGQADLRLLSGFPPPHSYSLYAPPEGENTGGPGPVAPQAVNDYAAALRLASAQGKPLLLDFTGWACVNCRKMEEHVWATPAIARLIREEFVLVSLYVDDRRPLPAAERFTFAAPDGSSRRIHTVGDKWAAFEALNFGQVTQPLYVLLSPEGALLNRPVGYTPEADTYERWLQCGLKTFHSRQ